jgi:hypothetical protein
METQPEKQKEHTSGNSQLLIDYRDVLIKAYFLGEEIKELYGILPPKCILDLVDNSSDFYGNHRGAEFTNVVISLLVN